MKQKFNIITSTCVPLPLENVDTTTRKPYPAIAHAACSRLEPEPKFFPATIRMVL